MEATLIGESGKLEKIWTDHFRRTGTYHMLVIDGLHITVLAAFLLFLLRVSFVPELGALALAAAGAWLYALVSGCNAPAVRAAGGFTFYLACRYFYRRRRLLNLLAGVAMLYLVVDPANCSMPASSSHSLPWRPSRRWPSRCSKPAHCHSRGGFPESRRRTAIPPRA